MSNRILVIEDDPDIAESLRYNLEREGLKPQVVVTGEQALVEALNEKLPPSLIILDIMLPGMSGMELCRRLRRESATRRTPIIMLTAKAGESERVAGLELGADDYITKPFSMRELLARVHGVLRRAEDASPEVYEDGRLRIDYSDVRASCNGGDVKLTNKEFAVLALLSKNLRRVTTRERILESVWGYQHYGDARTLDVHIRRLRQKLGACGGCIETVVGVGYRFLGCQKQPEPGSAELGDRD